MIQSLPRCKNWVSEMAGFRISIAFRTISRILGKIIHLKINLLIIPPRGSYILSHFFLNVFFNVNHPVMEYLLLNC